MHGREIRRKRRDMMIVLLRVIGQRLHAQLAARPSEIKWMFQQILLRNVVIDLVEMLVHKSASSLDVVIDRDSRPAITNLSRRFQNVFDPADGDDDPVGAMV